MRKKKILIPVIAAAVVIVAAAVLIIRVITKPKGFTETLPTDSVLTAEQALEDLDFIYRMISENHPCFLDNSELDKEIDSVYESKRSSLAESPEITVKTLWRSASDMCHTLGDAHTIVVPITDTYAEDWSKINGGEVVSIDGVPCADLLADFRSFFSYEPQVDFYADHMFGQVILRKSFLELLGIDTSDGADYEIIIDGETVTEHYDFVEGADVKGDDSGAELCSYTVDKENSIGIFTLNECVVNDEYKTALKTFFGEVNANNIQTVAVDLRENGGGNSFVINEFLRYIDVDEYTLFGGIDERKGGKLKNRSAEREKNKKVDNAFDGELYALTSNFTFSSGMNFAVAVADNNIGKIIGEIPGNMPGHYGDKLSFQCPNSGLAVSVSYKKFHRADSTKDGQPLIPDVIVEAERAIETLYQIAAKGEE
ncbi:MAG: peptidase S41 [Oscillospiraceae bacterium]|nr:peptidase S41 [Oscillospiraceae bacterium]